MRPPSPVFLAKWFAVGFASVVTAAGFWAYATHTHEELFDSELTSRANGVCADTHANLGSPRRCRRRPASKTAHVESSC